MQQFIADIEIIFFWYLKRCKSRLKIVLVSTRWIWMISPISPDVLRLVSGYCTVDFVIHRWQVLHIFNNFLTVSFKIGSCRKSSPSASVLDTSVLFQSYCEVKSLTWRPILCTPFRRVHCLNDHFLKCFPLKDFTNPLPRNYLTDWV